MVTSLKELDRDAMIRVLSEPRNALTKQYRKLLEMEDVELVFEPAALEAIADLAIKRKTGARGLRSILERIMRGTMYDVPSLDDVRQVVITREIGRETDRARGGARRATAGHQGSLIAARAGRRAARAGPTGPAPSPSPPPRPVLTHEGER